MTEDPRLTPARPDLAAAHLRGRVHAERYAAARTHTVHAPWTALRARPDAAAPQMSELLFGEPVEVYDSQEGWLWGQAQADGYVGYLRAEALEPGTLEASHAVATGFAHIYPEPRLKAPALRCLPMGARLALGEASETGRYLRLADGSGWISTRQIVPMDERQADPLTLAERFLGAPYLWGGKTAAGLDCSALIQLPLFMAGIELGRDSDLQHTAVADGLGRPVEQSEAERGDIVFFPGHVGFLVDRDRLLHANATHMAVTVDPLEDVLDWIRRDSEEAWLKIYRLAALE